MKNRRTSGLAFGLVIGLAVVSVAAAQSDAVRVPAAGQVVAKTQAEDDEVVLPSRVATAIERTQNALDRAEDRIDGVQYPAALLSLKAVGANIGRAHRAGLRQLNAVPVDEEEEETTSGPDSVVAVLTLEQAAITRLAGLFDTVTDPGVVGSVDSALSAALTNRDRMLDAVIALDPEEAGADYADGMADTLDGYADEVANLTEAIQVDRLSPAGRSALGRALARAKAAEAKISATFGGDE